MVNTMLLSLMVTASGIFETGKNYTKKAYDFSRPYAVQAYEVTKPYAKWIAMAVVVPCAYKFYKYMTKKTIKPATSKLTADKVETVNTGSVEPTKVEPVATTSTYKIEIQELLTKIAQGERNIVVSEELRSQMPLACQHRIEHAMTFLAKDNERTREAGIRKIEHTLRLCLQS